MLDQMDQRTVILIFSSLVLLGQTIFSIGIQTKSFPIMLLGRILFGIGGETVSVIQSAITTSQFKGKEIAFALGLNLCVSRLGSVFNSVLTPRIERASSVPVAVWCGTFTCFVSLLSAVWLTRLIIPTPASSKEDDDDNILDKRMQHDRHPLINRSASFSRTSSSSLDIITFSESTPLISKEATIILQIRRLPHLFWLLCLICVLLYSTVVPFNNIASDVLVSKWYPNDTQTAGMVMSIPDFLSALLVPFCGVLVDKYGNPLRLLLISALLIATAHYTLGFTMTTPIIPLLLLGISYSLYGVALWPSIANVVHLQEEKDGFEYRLVGTAYGISTSALNSSLTLFPIICAAIRVQTGDYEGVFAFFSFLGCVGAAICMITAWSDRDGVLKDMENNKGEEED